jgi:hypothetical protein
MKYACIAALSVLALSACSNSTVKDTLGLERAAPDEFRVVSRPPLSVPPQFSLRLPSNADVSPNQLTADKKARSIINGKEVAIDTAQDATIVATKETKSHNKHGSGSTKESTGSSGAESQFLKNAGAGAADPTVRDQLVEEKYEVQTQKEERAWWDIMHKDEEKNDPIVDSKKESDRIKKNEDEGKPVTEGKTPEVKAKEEGILTRILK